MAKLLKADDSEIDIAPRNPAKGLSFDELMFLVGDPVRLIVLNAESMMVITHDLITARRNHRATKILQFFSSDLRDEVLGATLLVHREELDLDS